MRSFVALLLAVPSFALLACTGGSSPGGVPPATGSATLAQIYFWRARPGKLEEYNRYIREVAEPIDAEARRSGAFLSVTTYLARDTASAWTHMRIFVLRDSAQLGGLGAALDRAGTKLEPDSAKRRLRGKYAVTLRDRIGSVTVELLP